MIPGTRKFRIGFYNNLSRYDIPVHRRNNSSRYDELVKSVILPEIAIIMWVGNSAASGLSPDTRGNKKIGLVRDADRLFAHPCGNSPTRAETALVVRPF